MTLHLYGPTVTTAKPIDSKGEMLTHNWNSCDTSGVFFRLCLLLRRCVPWDRCALRHLPLSSRKQFPTFSARRITRPSSSVWSMQHTSTRLSQKPTSVFVVPILPNGIFVARGRRTQYMTNSNWIIALSQRIVRVPCL